MMADTREDGQQANTTTTITTEQTEQRIIYQQ